jgi:hypothetical protein
MDANQPVNALVMEKYLLGELRGEKAAELEAAVARDPGLKKALEEMERSGRDFLSRFPAERIVPAILDRYRRKTSHPKAGPLFRPSRPWKRFLLLAPGVAAAALALLLILHPRPRKGIDLAGLDTSTDTTIIKGIPVVDLTKTQLLVFRRQGDKAELMQSGRTAAEGDLLQLAYVSGADLYGLILSLDGRGRVTKHFPLAPGLPGRLDLRTKVILPVAIELDDAPLFERFFFITSLRPIDEDDVLRRAAGLAADAGRAVQENLDLPEGLNQTSLIIYKGNLK